MLFKVLRLACVALSMLTLVSLEGRADERMFAYSYEADVLPEGGVEFEQWITSRAGREGGDYNRWEIREELEYGITDRLTTALYLNLKETYFSPKDETAETTDKFEFSGVSSEWKYQLINPNTNPVGVLLYGEGTFDSDEIEAEEKLVLSSILAEDWVAAVNATLEQEWAFEHSDTEKEGKLDLSAGIAHKFSPKWSAGLELRNIREFEGFELEEEEARAWYFGPNVHYGSASWWATLAVLPQVPLEGDRDLEHQERVNIRLLIGKIF
jgi:hypothetical protein